MSLFHAVILGAVEGLTEFLPVSSTAHLILANQLLKLRQTDFLTFFDIFIQSGAIFAVFVLYLSFILKNRYLWRKVFISFIPTAFVGFLLEKIITKVFFQSLFLIIFSLFFVGLIFIFVEFFLVKKKIILKKKIKEMTDKEAFLIGLIQSLSVLPGVSRAGSVILGMIGFGFKRDEAATYSFLLALPTIFAASFYQLIKLDFSLFNFDYLVFTLIGFFTSFFVAVFVVLWFINFLKKNSLIVFGIYRIIIALLFYFFIL